VEISCVFSVSQNSNNRQFVENTLDSGLRNRMYSARANIWRRFAALMKDKGTEKQCPGYTLV
ncbi:MAG TPA: hypothetical protein VFW00_04860, partial [Rhodocyclaceae bacterium]|nr:hypothetical protein [Rhodocyclaceae bacterium]